MPSLIDYVPVLVELLDQEVDFIVVQICLGLELLPVSVSLILGYASFDIRQLLFFLDNCLGCFLPFLICFGLILRYLPELCYLPVGDRFAISVAGFP